MDNRRRQFAAIDPYFAYSNTYHRLQDQFGIMGPYAWLMMILCAKRALQQGSITYTSESEFWQLIGMPLDAAPDLEAVLTLLGRCKQTVRTRSKHGLVTVTLSNFDDWQRAPGRQREAERKRASRAASRESDTADNTADNRADDTADDPSDKSRLTGEGQETSRTSPSTPTEREGDDEPPPQQAASSRLRNGRTPTERLASLAEHHKRYRPEAAEQYARNVGAVLTTTELARELYFEFEGIPPEHVASLLQHAGQPGSSDAA